MTERIMILGASRGLGAELVKCVSTQSVPVVGVSRKEELLAGFKQQFPLFEYKIADLSKVAGQDEVLKLLVEADYSKVFCIAGGGPYGPYHKRQMKAHDWAWEVTFRFPARVAHTLMEARKAVQLVFIGSAVAESAPDPGAASYTAAKHALRALFTTLRLESPTFDLRLFSPGYMDTDMLPQGADVRALGVYPAQQMALELWNWSLSADETGHKIYPPHPT